MREMIDAGTWESGFRLTVVNGCDMIANRLIGSLELSAKSRSLLAAMSPEDRRHYLSKFHVRTFDEVATDIAGESSMWDLLQEMLR
jgi:hypothetical protein